MVVATLTLAGTAGSQITAPLKSGSGEFHQRIDVRQPFLLACVEPAAVLCEQVEPELRAAIPLRKQVHLGRFAIDDPLQRGHGHCLVVRRQRPARRYRVDIERLAFLFLHRIGRGDRCVCAGHLCCSKAPAKGRYPGSNHQSREHCPHESVSAIPSFHMPGSAKIGAILIDVQRGPHALTAKPEDRDGMAGAAEKAAWNGRGG